MKTILIMIGAVYFTLSLFWVLYVAGMNFQRIKKRQPDKITTSMKVLAFPWIYFGMVLNASVNLFFLSPIFLSLPKKFGEACTQRFTRHHDDKNWRGSISRYFAHELVDVWDIINDGVHVPGEGHDE